jgi:hypothetical protein
VSGFAIVRRRARSAWLGYCVASLLAGLAVAPAQAAELDLEDTYFSDGLATALVIVRNEDEPRGYPSISIECVFDRAGRPVGTSRVEITDLRYRQHAAARFSAPVGADGFDHASCRIVEAKVG